MMGLACGDGRKRKGGLKPALLLALGFLLAGCGTVSREPENLQRRKAEIVAYVESGGYDRGLSAVAERARAWLAERAPRGGEKLTVVFDLDETLLRNWPHILADDFSYIPDRWDAWVNDAKASAIEPVREVYRAARERSIDVVFITSRKERQRAPTEKNLRALGLGDFARLVCQADDDRRSSREFKTEARRQLTQAGRTIVANIGDQNSDLAGGFAERTFKLPNPFYSTE